MRFASQRKNFNGPNTQIIKWKRFISCKYREPPSFTRENTQSNIHHLLHFIFMQLLWEICEQKLSYLLCEECCNCELQILLSFERLSVWEIKHWFCNSKNRGFCFWKGFLRILHFKSLRLSSSSGKLGVTVIVSTRKAYWCNSIFISGTFKRLTWREVE